MVLRESHCHRNMETPSTSPCARSHAAVGDGLGIFAAGIEGSAVVLSRKVVSVREPLPLDGVTVDVVMLIGGPDAPVEVVRAVMAHRLDGEPVR